ncbi:MAG: hypothetical protein ACLR4Z_03975 [Butyricicoccaceae bacterium]
MIPRIVAALLDSYESRSAIRLAVAMDDGDGAHLVLPCRTEATMSGLILDQHESSSSAALRCWRPWSRIVDWA